MGFFARTVADVAERRASSALVSSFEKPAAWLLDALGAGPTPAGTRVSESTAARVSTVYACVRIISEDVGRLPFIPYERTEGGRRRATDHRLWRLITSRANDEMPTKAFRELMMSHAALWGAGFSEIELDNGDNPIGFWPLLPGVTRAVRRGGKKYVVTRIPGEEKDVALPPGRYLHLPGPSWMGDGLNADHPIRMARDPIGLAMAAEMFGARLFGNGARPSGILTYDGKLGKEKRSKIVKDWESAFSGLSNSQRTALLEANLKWQATSFEPDKMQSLETRKHEVEEVARYWRMPLFLLGHTEKATTWGTGLEQIMRGYVAHTLGSWLNREAEWYAFQLLDESEVGRFYFEHVLEDLLKGDIATRFQAYAIAVQNGWMNRNEVRSRENMNEIPAEEGGNAYTIQLNMGGLAEISGGDGTESFAQLPAGGKVLLLSEVTGKRSASEIERTTAVGQLLRLEVASVTGAVRLLESAPGAALQLSWTSLAGTERSELLQLEVRGADGELDPEKVRQAELAAWEKTDQLARAKRSVTARRRLRRRFADIFEQMFSRGIHREVTALKRLSKRLEEGASDQLSPEAFVEEVAAFYEVEALRAGRETSGHMAWMEREYRKPLTAYTELLQDEIVDERDADELPASAASEVILPGYLVRFLRRHAARSVNQMRRIAQRAEAAELRAAVDARLEEWDEKRPGKLAAEEAVHGGDSITRMTYFAVGVISIEWLAFGENCPLCDELNGQVVGVQEVFLKKGETVDPDDGETQPLTTKRAILHPPLHLGCDCSVSAV